jgi:hypothetical protein
VNNNSEGYWVVYNVPAKPDACADATVQWLARWCTYEGPTKTILTSGNVDRLRVKLALDGFVRIARRDHDDPLIVESWI